MLALSSATTVEASARLYGGVAMTSSSASTPACTTSENTATVHLSRVHPTSAACDASTEAYRSGCRPTSTWTALGCWTAANISDHRR